MANNFSDAINIYRFESGSELIDDQGGTSLTPVNTPGYDSATQIEGDQSADLVAASNECYILSDASLPSTYPLKSSSTEDEYSLSILVWPDLDTGVTRTIFAKHDTGTNDRGLTIRQYLTYFQIYIGTGTGSTFETLYSGSSGEIPKDKKLHIGFTYKFSTKAWTLRCYNITDTVQTLSTGGSSTAVMRRASCAMGIGDSLVSGVAYSGSWDGLIDEVVQWNSIKDADDWDAIIAGTYSAGAPPATYQETASDGLSIGEALSSVATLQAIANDGLNLGENNFALAAMISALVDGVAIGDSSLGPCIFPAVAADGVVLSESIAITGILNGNAVDGITFSDALASTATLLALSLDGVSVSDTALADLLGLIVEATDGIVFSDSASGIAAFLATALDGIQFSDLASAIGAFNSIGADGVTFIDSAAYGSIVEGLAADGITLTDSAIAVLSTIASIADGFTIGDTGAVSANFSVTCADGASFSETISAIMTFAATAADTFRLGDVAVHLQAAGLVTVAFSASRATITFSVSRPGVSFLGSKPGIIFSA